MRFFLLMLLAVPALMLAAPKAEAKRAQAQVTTATYSTHAKPHLRRAAARHAPRLAQAHRRPAVSPAS